MSKSKQELIDAMMAWPKQAEEWKQVPENKWHRPLGPGKWTAAEAVAHLLKWDRYFLERAVRPVAEQGPITLEHTDFDSFNKEAAVFGASTPPEQLLDDAIAVRNEILSLLGQQPDRLFQPEQAYLDGAGHRFDVEEYMTDFISHDHHHMDQIRASFAQE
ncbi:DinB family protein [Gorillibacterium sp. sgz500922]|uniref:DinB family protein n=1 Tax=Gorillibacterium sp. sgz500922 TaxID=3446694 RepID=UPI003F666F35